jgi:serine phosphatase RsbU (regulator of sigma subunit)
MLYGELDLTTGDFVYACAGHDHRLIWDQRGKLIAGEQARSVVLGLLPVPRLAVQQLRLKPSATVFFSTNGVLDTMNTDDLMLDRARLVTLAQPLAKRSPQALCKAIVDKMMQDQGVDIQFNDIRLLAMRLN